MNLAILVGRLGMDPELKYAQSGTAVLRLRLATNDRTKKDGAYVDEVTWHTVVCFGKRAEGLQRVLTKGSRVGVRGRISVRSWESRDGDKRTATEILADDVELLGEEGTRSRAKKPPATKGGGDGDDDIAF